MLLSDVIDCHGPDGGEIDFLKIDVEGWEAGVIASGDWTRHRPRVLVIEAVDDKGNLTYEAWDPDLLGAGYRFAMFDGLNRFYCREEDAGLGALANENATAEARMASLEMDLSRREAADPSRRARNPFEGIFFRPDGRPVKPLRRLLFQTSGAPRRFLRALVLHKNGTPRSAFAHWMGTAKYLGLSNAVNRPGHHVRKRDDAATASRSA